MKPGFFSLIAIVVLFNCGNPDKTPPDNEVDTPQDTTQWQSDSIDELDEDQHSMIKVENPRPGQAISSPLNIKGQAVGNWYFEANFPIKLFNSEGQLIAENYATAGSEWMTEEFVPFEASLNFSAPGTREGELVFEKANPSGLEENDMSFTVPVIFATQ